MGIIETHRKIMFKLIEMGENDRLGMVKISDLASVVRSDPRTIKKHLSIAEIDNVGKFNSDKTVFKIKKLGTLFEDEEKLKEVRERWKEIKL